jgi:hypothetical protein
VKVDNALMPLMFPRTLKLKVRPESYGWLSAAAVEVNQVFNYCNETSLLAATRTDLKRKWLSGFDLCALTAGAAQYFERIGADTIQRVCVEYAQKRVAAKRYRRQELVLPGEPAVVSRRQDAPLNDAGREHCTGQCDSIRGQ